MRTQLKSSTSHALFIRENSVALERRDAAFRRHSFNDADNTIEAIVATTTPVQRQGYVEVLDIAGADLGALRGASVLDAHQQGSVSSILGTVDQAWREGDTIVARLRLSTRPELAATIDGIRNGIITNVSIGYDVQQWQDRTDASGQRTRTAVKWRPREVSFVPVAADPAARTRSAPTDRASVNRSIRDLTRRLGVPLTVADDLIDRGASFEESNVRLLTEMMTRSGTPIRASVHGTDYSDPAMQTRAIEDALFAKLTGTAPQGAARELANRTTIALMEHHAQVTGLPLRSTNPAEIYGAVMQTRAGMLTTSDFPTLLSNTMGRRLGELFRAAQSGASAIVATGTVNDFRPITEVRTSSFPSLEAVNQSGEIKWGSLDEEGEVLAIASFARGITISFQVAVNDDLNAIDRAIRDTAFAAAMLKAKLIVAALSATLSDGKALFHSDHGNLAGSGAAPSETTLSAGRLGLMKQTPPGSTEPLGLAPAILLVPGELQTSSEKLIASIYAATVDDVNAFTGKLQVAVEPRLPDAKQWFLFAAPNTYPLIRFLTLAGFEGPRFETNQEFSRLGTSYRVHWHCGAGPVDHRGAWKNPGQ